jgi:acetylornithine deacetylase
MISAQQMLARLIAFDTTSSASNLALIEDVADYLDGYGVPSRLLYNERGDKANLFATVGPAGDGGIVLSGHTDCVPPGGGWSSDPFKAQQRDGRIFGRGACDMKGFIAVALALVPEMLSAKLKTPLHLAFSYDEELGCSGVPTLIDKIAKELPQPRIAIVGEPTSMKLVNAHKGIYSFETVVKGLEAHSSLTHTGVSAISGGAEVVRELDRLARELAERGPFGAAFAPPYTTINVGLIAGGTAVNVVPGECRIRWECRPVPGHDPAEILGGLERFVDERLERMRRLGPEVTIETTREVAVPPLMPEAESPAEALVRRAAAASGAASGVSFATEAGLFQAARMSAVVVGPGSIEHAHKPDEHVTLPQLDACERFLRGVIAEASEASEV